MKIRTIVTNVALTAVCLILVIPIIVYTFPFILGADSSYTVMSGSMSPALSPGDLVIVKGEEPIDIGDMVTVESGEFIFTHRVVEVLDGDRFRLKGDANEEPDQGLVEASQIIGKVVLVIPFGHLYTPYGFAMVLLAPAALIIGKQLHTVYQFTKRRNKRETMRWRRKSKSPLDMSTLLLALILTVSTTRVIAPNFIAGSSSYFSDVEVATGFFSAGIWEIGVLIEIKPDTLNLNSTGKWITAFVYIDTEYDAEDVKVDSILLNGMFQAEWVKVNGSLRVKFERASLIEYLIEENHSDGDVIVLTVSGRFTDGVRFTGEDTIKVINHKG